MQIEISVWRDNVEVVFISHFIRWKEIFFLQKLSDGIVTRL